MENMSKSYGGMMVMLGIDCYIRRADGREIKSDKLSRAYYDREIISKQCNISILLKCNY